MIVEVRDAATSAPISGARVFADTPSRDHPFSVASILGQTGPMSTRAVTDERGRARVEGVEDRPVRIGVVAPGRGPVFTLFDREQTDWRTLTDVADPASPPVQVRIEPTSTTSR